MIKWNAELMLPTDNDYQNRILDIKHGESKSSGNLMITLQAEIVAPTIKEIDGEEVDVTGVKAVTYCTTHIYDDNGDVDEEKTKNARKFTSELLSNLGLTEEIDWDNIQPQLDTLKGKIILTAMEADIQEQRKTPTKSQLEEAKRKGIHPLQAGDVMKHPVTGKKLVKFWPKIKEIYALAPDQSMAKGGATQY